MESIQDFSHGEDALDEKVQRLLLHVRGRHRLLVAQGRVEVVLPRQLVWRVQLAGQGQLVLDKLCDLVLVHVAQVPEIQPFE